MRNLWGRAKSKVLRLLGREVPSNYYDDPEQYWNKRHARHGDSLGGVGTLHMSEDLNRREYDRKWQHVEAVLEEVREGESQSLLDAGCGNGFFSRRARTLGFTVDAVDFSGEAIDIAKADPAAGAIRWHVASLEEFRTDRQFDVVMSIDVLFHVVDDALWQATVTNLASLAASDGCLLVQEHLVPEGNPVDDRGVHVRWRTESDYRHALADWDLVKVDHYDLPDSHSWKDLLLFRRGKA